MIRDDRELLAELARLNRAMVPLAMSIMEGSASADEQRTYARRLIEAGERLQRRANTTSATVIDGEVLITGPLTLSPRSVEPYAES